MSAIPQPDLQPPDLTLRVQRSDKTLTYFLTGRHLEKDVEGHVTLEAEPRQHLTEVLDQLGERLGAADGSGDGSAGSSENLARIRLEGLGVSLGRDLIPESIHTALLALVPAPPSATRPAPSLLIVSDERTIPWEILRLVTDDRAGPFLGEAFALSRWHWNHPLVHSLPLARPALMVSKYSGLGYARSEGESLAALWREHGLETQSVKPELVPLLEAFASSPSDTWHLIAHGNTERQDPRLWQISLSDERGLQASDLADPKWSLRRARPLVFLNACRSATGALSLHGESGLAQAFIEAGAGAVIGSNWVVTDGLAAFFALVFYREYLAGQPLAEAARRARIELRDDAKSAADPTWLAFTVFGHPRAQRQTGLRPAPAIRRDEPVLVVPRAQWHPQKAPPGALLQAQFGIVPFHRRETEIDDLWRWCADPERPIAVRLYTGPGGMGKTRLLLEHCQRLRERGWRTGFIPDAMAPDEAAEQLIQRGPPFLAVIDYAENRHDLITTVLSRLAAQDKPGPYRFILLARLREEWWEQLRIERGAAGGLLASAATQHEVLKPLGQTTPLRLETYRTAGKAFAEILQQEPPSAPPEAIDADYFKPVLMLHMSALGTVQEGKPLGGEDEILDWVLDRERRFWRNGLKTRELRGSHLRGVGRAMAAFTLAGGAETRSQATALIEALRSFRGEPYVVIEDIADLLHETYPGPKWITPVQPDILGEHLIERELANDPQEIFDLVLGPREETE